MRTWLAWLSRQNTKTFFVLLAITLLVIIGMQLSGTALKNQVAPGGIVSFELAGSLENSQAIIHSWEGTALGWAWANMLLDFLFIACYGLTLALACMLLASRLESLAGGLALWSRWMAGAVLIAAGLDVVENVSLMTLLAGWQAALPAVMAKWCAIPKFGLLLLALVSVLVGFGILLLARIRRPRLGA